MGTSPGEFTEFTILLPLKGNFFKKEQRSAVIQLTPGKRDESGKTHTKVWA